MSNQMVTHGSDVKFAPGWKQAEVAYGDGGNPDNGSLWVGHTVELSPADVLANDMETLNGSEFATRLVKTENRYSLNNVIQWLSADILAVVMEMSLGDVTKTQEAPPESNLASYKRYNKPVAMGTSLKSIGGILSKPGLQEALYGLKVDAWTLKSTSGNPLELTITWGSSGKRTVNGDTIPAALTATALLHARFVDVFVNANPHVTNDIIAAANIAQDQDNISQNGTLTPISKYVNDWEVSWNLNNKEIAGHGGGGYLQAREYDSRSLSVKININHDHNVDPVTGKSWKDLYDEGTPLAMEFRCISDELVDPNGANYDGFTIRVPLCKINSNPEPNGGPRDVLTQAVEVLPMADGTNPIFDVTVWSSQATQLA